MKRWLGAGESYVGGSAARHFRGILRLLRKLRKILVEYSLVLCLSNCIGSRGMMGNHHACFQKLPSFQRDSPGHFRK